MNIYWVKVQNKIKERFGFKKKAMIKKVVYRSMQATGKGIIQ